MKKIYFLLLFLVFSFSGFSQNPMYVTESNINYYAAASDVSDAYRAERCKLDIHYPKNKTNNSTIVWFHGGGLTGGNKEFPPGLLNKGFIVIAVGYRLAPKAKVKDIIEDAAAAVAWVFKNIHKYGGSSKLIFVSGHSAGAYLDLMLTLDKRYLAKHDIDADSIAGLIPFSGHGITHFTARQEMGLKEVQPLINELAPLYFVRPTGHPIILLTGDRELEMLGRYEENAYLARMLKLAGHKNTLLFEMVSPGIPLLIKEVNKISKEIKSRQ
jgi:acetyl esterase/lipase